MNTSFFSRTFLLWMLLASFFFISAAEGQSVTSGINSDGRDFYIGYVYPSYNINPPSSSGRNVAGFFNVLVLITCYDTNAIVKLSYFDSTGKETVAVSKLLYAHQGFSVALDQKAMLMSEPGDKSEFKACHITSTKAINVQYFSTGACSGGSYLALPTPALGKKYVIASYNDNPGIGAATNSGSQGEMAGGGGMIIAPFDSTHVTIIPTGRTKSGHIGVNSGAGANGTEHPYTVTLKRGHCYLFKGNGTDQDLDLSGSTVESDKPIAVLGFHENAMIGDVGQRYLEARDFMIEQLMPAEAWDWKGYVNIPLKDTQPQDEAESGYGENYRVFTNNENGAKVDLTNSNNVYNMFTGKFTSPTPERDNIGTPVDFSSEDKHKFGVMLYDNRGQGSKSPYPAECMMTIVPMSRWKTQFVMYVPANTFEVLQNYFVNIIAEKNDIDKQFIKYSFNGGLLQPVSKLSSQGSYLGLPDYPDLKGVRYSVSPGTYYFINTRTAPDPTVAIDTLLHGAFMVYHYGMRAIDPDRDLGDFCGDDNFFAYANPIGMSLSSDDPAKFETVIDSKCVKWNICVTDHRALDQGIRSVELLNDPLGIMVSPGRQSVNVEFDQSFDPAHFGEVLFNGRDSSVCFSVSVIDPYKEGFAAVMITDNAGNKKVIELRYGAPKLSVTPDSIPINFGIHGKGSDQCIDVVIKNTETVASQALTILNAILLGSGNGHFVISSVNPPLPAQLQIGESMIIRICYSGSDTSIVRDSLRLDLSCFPAVFPLQGQGSAPMIMAGDLNFGGVDTGQTLCLGDTIKNIGNAPLVLQKDFIVHDAAQFRVADSARFPLTIQPGKSEIISVCYSPQKAGLDSSTVDWITNEKDHAVKDYSILRGNGMNLRLVWSINSFIYITDTLTIVKHRLWLKNPGTRDVFVDKVELGGADASEFAFVANQTGNFPISNFTLLHGDSIWIDIRFMPQFTGAPPQRYHDRHAFATASAAGEKNAVLDLSAIFNVGSSEVKPSSEPKVSGAATLSVRPNPASGKSIILSVTNGESGMTEVGIYDILGREIYHKNILLKANTEEKLEIPIHDLPNGTYYARISSDGKIVTEEFEVMR